MKTDHTIRGSCSRFVCRYCRTKYGWQHQDWCDYFGRTDPCVKTALIIINHWKNADILQSNKKGGICRLKKINVRFEKDKTINYIDIVIRADEKDDQIVSLSKSFRFLKRQS